MSVSYIVLVKNTICCNILKTIRTISRKQVEKKVTGWGFCSHNNYKQIKVYIPSNLLLIYSNIEYNNRRYFQGVSALCLKLCSSHLIISWRSSRFLAHCNILPLISSGDVLDIMNFHLVSDGGCAVWRNLYSPCEIWGWAYRAQGSFSPAWASGSLAVCCSFSSSHADTPSDQE